jgi:hypothetical protein
VAAGQPGLVQAVPASCDQGSAYSDPAGAAARATPLAAHAGAEQVVFPPIGEFIDMMSIDVYGERDLAVVDQLRRKAAILGTGTVRVHALHAAFARAPSR